MLESTNHWFSATCKIFCLHKHHLSSRYITCSRNVMKNVSPMKDMPIWVAGPCLFYSTGVYPCLGKQTVLQNMDGSALACLLGVKHTALASRLMQHVYSGKKRVCMQNKLSWHLFWMGWLPCLCSWCWGQTWATCIVNVCSMIEIQMLKNSWWVFPVAYFLRFVFEPMVPNKSTLMLGRNTIDISVVSTLVECTTCIVSVHSILSACTSSCRNVMVLFVFMMVLVKFFGITAKYC